MIKGYIIGRVKLAPKIFEPEGKSKFAGLTVESTRSYNGRDYTTQVQVNVYGKPIDEVSKIPVGASVFAEGEISATAREYNGKYYANIKMVGNVHVLSLPEPVVPTATESNAEKPGEEDDVPF